MKKRNIAKIFVSVIAMTLALACVFMMLTACSVSYVTYSAENPVKISFDEFIGWWEFLIANGGLKTTPDSLNAKLGIYIEYVIMNDATASSSALISGELQGAGYTVNRYAFLQEKFDQAGLEVQMPFISNFSNGGDGIVARSGIVSVNDLVGKKIAVPKYSEAQTLVEWLLNNSSLTEAQRAQIRKDMVYFETPDDAAKAFFAGSVDAAATWEPYLTQAKSSTDSCILFDTSMSTNLILDGVVFSKEFLENNSEFVEKWIDAALQARSLYKVDFDSIREMPLFELMSDEEIIDMANGADLTTWTQNKELLNDAAVTMYHDMAEVWKGLGEVAYPDKAKDAFTDEYIMKLKDKYEGKEEEIADSFATGDIGMIIESPAALLSYSADIKFQLNSVNIQQESFAELDEFVKVAKVLDGVYVQIEGNASQRAEGVSEAQIVEFSRMRAQSIANYFTSKGISAERIIVIGNGDANPIDPEEPAAAENRRTEIFFKTKVGY